MLSESIQSGEITVRRGRTPCLMRQELLPWLCKSGWDAIMERQIFRLRVWILTSWCLQKTVCSASLLRFISLIFWSPPQSKVYQIESSMELGKDEWVNCSLASPRWCPPCLSFLFRPGLLKPLCMKTIENCGWWNFKNCERGGLMVSWKTLATHNFCERGRWHRRRRIGCWD